MCKLIVCFDGAKKLEIIKKANRSLHTIIGNTRILFSIMEKIVQKR